MPEVLRRCRLASLALVLLLSACSGGGGADEDSISLTLSSEAVRFTATSPRAASPEPETVTATFGPGIAQVSAVHSGAAIDDIEFSISGQTAQIRIVPPRPRDIGSGIFNGAVAVTGFVCADAACSTLSAGPTRTISVSYQVSPIVDLVAPYVATAGTSDTVLLRGQGFSAFNIAAVNFGSTPATNFAEVLGLGGIELRVVHPELVVGTYPVHIEVPDHQGEVISDARLVVVAPTSYAAQALAYPAPGPVVRSLIYDPERAALLVATEANGGTILRYAFDGTSWGAPTSVALPGLMDMTLSIRGTDLLALTRTALTPVDPLTLAPGTPVEPPELAEGSFLKSIAVTNSDTAVVTTGTDESATTTELLYRNGEIVEATLSLNNATVAGSADGSKVVFVQGHPDLDGDPAVFLYTAETNNFTNGRLNLNQNEFAPVVNRTGSRVILNGRRVYIQAGDFAILGLLPETTLAVALRPDGTRAYTYDSEANGILTFDISEPVDDDDDEGVYTPLGPAVPLIANPGTGVKMTISHDGRTLFLAGSTQLVIQPTP
ncbi:MAG TPA: hypothetical protein VF193_06380 [Steroidobacter sp.]